MGANKYSKLFSKSNNADGQNDQSRKDKEAINAYVERVHSLLLDEKKAKMAAQLITQLLNQDKAPSKK